MSRFQAFLWGGSGSARELSTPAGFSFPFFKNVTDDSIKSGAPFTKETVKPRSQTVGPAWVGLSTDLADSGSELFQTDENFHMLPVGEGAGL